MESGAKAGTAEMTEDLIQQELIRKAKKKERLTQFLPYAGILVLILLFTILTKGKFLSIGNIQLLLNQSFTLVIVICGATYLYAMGSFDLSLGQVMAVSSLVMTLMFQKNIPFAVCLLAAVGIAVGCMCITATAKNYLRISPFISSMCVANVATGIVSYKSKVMGKIVFPYSKAAFLNNPLVKLIVLLLIIGIGYVLFNYTELGKSVRAIGGSERVSRISGIKVEKVNYQAYILMGVLIAIAGAFTTARAGVVDPTLGSSMNLNVMVAIVLGGFPLSGGANAKFLAPVIGALMVVILTNGLGMLGQANAVGYLLKGVLFVIVVALTYEKSKGKLVE